jgi:hypothetical protein
MEELQSGIGDRTRSFAIWSSTVAALSFVCSEPAMSGKLSLKSSDCRIKSTMNWLRRSSGSLFSSAARTWVITKSSTVGSGVGVGEGGSAMSATYRGDGSGHNKAQVAYVRRHVLRYDRDGRFSPDLGIPAVFEACSLLSEAHPGVSHLTGSERVLRALRALFAGGRPENVDQRLHGADYAAASARTRAAKARALQAPLFGAGSFSPFHNEVLA